MTVVRAALLATLLLATACTSPDGAPGPDGGDAGGGRRLVLLLDRSTSMRDNDAADAARSGVDVALALLGRRDEVGVVTFAEAAEVVVPVRPAGGTDAREAARQALAGLDRNGVSNVGLALETARLALEARGAPRGSSIVFLTDGVPYRQARGRRLGDGPGVREAVEAIAARGYRIFAIALGAQASTPFLTQLVASTGGAVFVARDAAALLPAFEAVAVEALGYLRAERGHELTVLPHTKRVAFLGRWEGSGRVGAVLRDGQAVPDAALVRTPAGGGAFCAALVEAPEPGVWSAELTGARETVLLVEPGFGVELLPGTPQAVPSGGEVPVTVGLLGDPALVEEARKALTLRARVERDGAAGGAAWTLLTPGAPARLVAPQVPGETAGRIVVEAQVVLGGRSFELRRTRALTIGAGAAPAGSLPPVPLELALRPTTFERTLWQGDRLDPVRLVVKGDPTRAVRVRCGGVTREVPAGGSEVLEVPCPEDGVVAVQAEAVAADGVAGAPPWSGSVRGTLRRLTLSPASLVVPATPAGLPSRPAPFEPTIAPGGRVALSPDLPALVGPGGHELTLERTDAGFVARPPADAPPGLYRGKLVVVAEEPRGLRSREVPVTLEVQPPVRAPAPVVVSGAWGWVSRPVEVAWPSLEEVPAAIVPGALTGPGGTIDPELDIRVVPLDGWSGERLSREPRRFALQVFLSSDLPAGRYEGQVELVVDGRALPIPVELEVRR